MLSDFFEVRPPNVEGCLLGTWEVIGKKSCGLEQICGCLYVHFEVILCYTRIEEIGCSKTFRGNANGAKYPAQRYKSRWLS